VASALLFTSSLLLVASIGFAQDEPVCGDFAAPEDAQVALDEDPDLASSLDSDGNGTACDEDPGLFAQATDTEDTTQTTTESTTESTNESTNESTTEAEEDTSPEPEDSGASNARSQQTPATGGVALVPLAGSTLTALLGGSMILRRRV
jgi:hypothetical protein